MKTLIITIVNIVGWLLISALISFVLYAMRMNLKLPDVQILAAVAGVVGFGIFSAMHIIKNKVKGKHNNESNLKDLDGHHNTSRPPISKRGSQLQKRAKVMMDSITSEVGDPDYESTEHQAGDSGDKAYYIKILGIDFNYTLTELQMVCRREKAKHEKGSSKWKEIDEACRYLRARAHIKNS